MKNKKFLIFVIAVAVILVIGVVAAIVGKDSGKLSAEAAEKWTLTPDSGITINISDGVDQVRAGDVLNYRIDFAYQGAKITTQEEMNKAIDDLILKLNLKTTRDNVQLAMDGFLATGKVMITSNILNDRTLSQYQFPKTIGTISWLLRYPNFGLVLNQLKPGATGTFNIPAVVASNIFYQDNKVQGIVYVYLTTNTGFTPRKILVAKAVDEDTLISGGSVVPTPTPTAATSPTTSPTASPSPPREVTSLEISPKSPGFAIGGQQINFTAMAVYADGSRNEITRDPNIQWEAITTRAGSQAATIGTISNWGVFAPTIWSIAGIARDTPPVGKIKATFNGLNVETSEFSVLAKYLGL